MLGHQVATHDSIARRTRQSMLGLIAAIVGLSLGLTVSVAPASATTYTVTTTADDNLTPPAGSLREAINNANSNPGADIIDFAIPTVGMLQTIQPVAALPAIAEQVLIDGTTQVNTT